MPLNLKGSATIKNINIRKQGKEEEKELAVDVKFQMEGVDARVLVPILGVPDWQGMRETFWLDDKDANIRFSGLTEITSWAEFGDCDLKIFRRKIRAEKVSKFSLKPKSGYLVDLSLTVAIVGPDNPLIDSLAASILDDVTIEIQGEPDLFDGAQD